MNKISGFQPGVSYPAILQLPLIQSADVAERVSPHNMFSIRKILRPTHPIQSLAGWISFLAVTLLILVSVGRECAVFKSQPTNGAFQLFNPLTRMHQGQVIGLDFDFFHGPGTLMLHYPLFTFLGGDLSASELSRHLMSPVFYLLCFLVLARVWKIPGYVAFLVAGLVLVLGTFVDGSGAFSGNSMVGLRSSLPVMVLPLALLLSNRFIPFKRHLALLGFIGFGLAVSMYVATEQGLAATGLMVLWVLGSKEFGPLGKRFLLAAYTGVLCILIFVGLIWIGSEGNLREPIQFILSDVPGAQFWYYGGPPNIIPDWPEVIWNRSILIGFWGPFALMLLEIFRLRKRPSGSHVPMESMLVFFLLAHSMIVQIPHLTAYSHYHIVSNRNMGLVGMLWTWRVIRSMDLRRLAIVRRVIAWRVPCLVTGGLVVAAPFAMAFTVSKFQRNKQQTASPIRYQDMHITENWADDLTTWKAIGGQGATVAGTYKSLVEDQEKSSFQGPDYIIHALGSRRETFLSRFKELSPDFFITLNSDSGYEEWVQLRHWDVYAYLLQNYAPVASTDFHQFWKKKVGNPSSLEDPAVPSPALKTQLQEGAWSSEENQNSTCLYRVRVSYQVENPWEKIPVLGKLPRFLVSRDVVSAPHTHSYLSASLPPTETEWSFPLVLNQGERAQIRLSEKMKLPMVTSKITAVTLTEVSRDPAVIDALVNRKN